MQQFIDSCLEKELNTKETKENNKIEADSMSTTPLTSPEDLILSSISNSPDDKKCFLPPPKNYLFGLDYEFGDFDLYKEPEKFEEKEKVQKEEDVEEILFTCELCGKTYLSQSALYTHRKIKHNFVKPRIISDPNKNPRGRPRKEEVPIEDQIYFDPKTTQYFTKSDRVGTVENYEYYNCIIDAFDKLYGEKNKNKKKIFDNLGLKYNNISSHSFFEKFLNDSHDKYKIIVNLNEKIDNIFISYLNRISLYCNPDYYTKVICFIILFRDFVDKKKVKKSNKIKVENIPYFSNDFINSFFNDKSCDNFIELSSSEAIELMINFCQWLFDNNYTSAKISLN